MNKKNILQITDAYQTLGLPLNANIKEIKSKRRRLLQKLHPDKHPGCSPEKVVEFNEIVQAANLLQNLYKLNKNCSLTSLTNNKAMALKACAAYQEIAKY